MSAPQKDPFSQLKPKLDELEQIIRRSVSVSTAAAKPAQTQPSEAPKLADPQVSNDSLLASLLSRLFGTRG